jgi:hypothetical protein
MNMRENLKFRRNGERDSNSNLNRDNLRFSNLNRGNLRFRNLNSNLNRGNLNNLGNSNLNNLGNSNLNNPGNNNLSVKGNLKEGRQDRKSRMAKSLKKLPSIISVG